MKWQVKRLIDICKTHVHRPGEVVYHYGKHPYYSVKCNHCPIEFYLWDNDIGRVKNNSLGFPVDWEEVYKFTFSDKHNSYTMYGNLSEHMSIIKLDHLMCPKLTIML